MKRRVQWSRHALNDLKTQILFIAQDNPAVATRIADKINEAALALGEFATGRPGRVYDTYEKVIVGLPYIIAYAITKTDLGEFISILRVIHTSRE